MKRWIRAVLVFAVAVLFVASLAMAASWKGSEGWGMSSQYQRMFNPATIETMSGTVDSVDQIRPMKGMYYGIHIKVKTDKETIEVHLGPGWYIERLDTRIEKGDKIGIRGSRVTMEGKAVIIAAEIKKGDNTLILRDSSGVPAWAGWKR